MSPIGHKRDWRKEECLKLLKAILTTNKKNLNTSSTHDGLVVPNLHVKVKKVKSFSHVQLFGTLWTVAHQGPPFMGILQARIL